MLETTRRPAGTKNFAIIQGYIPNDTEKKFKHLTKDYVSVLENTKVQNKITEEEMIATGGWTEMDINKEKTPVPTLFSNKKYIKTFEVITQSQGIPGSGERDPTPLIAFVWPLFYGIMFADLGHGLLLFGLGMLLRQRGNGSITTWGTLLAASGAGRLSGRIGNRRSVWISCNRNRHIETGV